MNWFQIVFLREQSQGTFSSCSSTISCELISNCIFTWAITNRDCNTPPWAWLWIDFKLYFYVSNHKVMSPGKTLVNVVNWFQIVFLREQSQAPKGTPHIAWSCELISNCIFTWAITSAPFKSWLQFELWIDFKLYFYVSNHKEVL